VSAGRIKYNSQFRAKLYYLFRKLGNILFRRQRLDGKPFGKHLDNFQRIGSNGPR